MIQKQTVCIATDKTKKEGYSVPKGFIGKYGYFFTPEQLNEYTANVIKQALETAAENVEPDYWKGSCELCGSNVVDKKSITNTFEETFKLYQV